MAEHASLGRVLCTLYNAGVYLGRHVPPGAGHVDPWPVRCSAAALGVSEDLRVIATVVVVCSDVLIGIVIFRRVADTVRATRYLLPCRR